MLLVVLSLLSFSLSRDLPHTWVEVRTSDTTTDYYYDPASIQTTDSTTSAWVKKVLRRSTVYKLHRFVFQCESKKFISCDSEILCTNIGDTILDVWNKGEVWKRIFPLQLSTSNLATDKQLFEEICDRRTSSYFSPIGSH